MLELKLQYFGHLMWRVDSLEKTLMLGKIECRRRRGWQKMRWLDGVTDSVDMSLCKTLGFDDGQGGLAFCNSWGHKESDTTKGLDWTEPIWKSFQSLFHWMFFIPYSLFLLLWDFNDTSLRSLLIVPYVSKVLFIYFQFTFFPWELHWFTPTFHDSILCHLHCITESIQCIICLWYYVSWFYNFCIFFFLIIFFYLRFFFYLFQDHF